MDNLSNISKQATYITTCCIRGFQEHVFNTVIKKIQSKQTCSWKSKGKQVVKSDVHMIMLLMASLSMLSTTDKQIALRNLAPAPKTY